MGSVSKDDCRGFTLCKFGYWNKEWILMLWGSITWGMWEGQFIACAGEKNYTAETFPEWVPFWMEKCHDFSRFSWNWQCLIQKTNIPPALLNRFSIRSVQIHFPWICCLVYELHIYCILLVDSPCMLYSSLSASVSLPRPHMRTQLWSCFWLYLCVLKPLFLAFSGVMWKFVSHLGCQIYP